MCKRKYGEGVVMLLAPFYWWSLESVAQVMPWRLSQAWASDFEIWHFPAECLAKKVVF